ncbi:HAMP domain-containing histidine kinase [Anaerobacillus sp. CMMVII]|uniref:sensor histidine kinase n=1 Tax=Anaerobacillus sp. CMMVII TaxID=2755588 RepID=UPI0021B7518C|nr:HAMP domain-containing sensor histidine kinase [Anaerobacillus sp. CMMVII]MCT8139206.1 HAMP domain-containing histidine kinase [Anaerobacillus sp. CMMVII]
MWKVMKIQYQLWLIYSCVFICVTLVVYMVVSRTYEHRLQVGYEQVSITQGTTILNQFKETYPYSPNRSIGYLRTYSEQINSRLIMLDEEKKVYVDSFNQLVPNTILHLTILKKETVPGSIFSNTEAFGYVQYTLLPFQTGESKGYLLMVQDANELFAEVTSFQRWMIQTLLIAVFSFFMISYIVSTWFSKPIRQIITQLKKITPQKRVFSVKHQRQDEVKALIDAIKNMVEELNLYDDRQRRFLSTSSHELKTPLTTMQLIVENLPYVREQEALYGEFVQDLAFQVKKMQRLVDQLLRINSIWDDKCNKELINIHDIQEHLLDSFQYIALGNEIELKFDLEPLEFYVDRELFYRALENLVSNAIRYSPKGRQVKITSKREKGWNKISICDHGIGIGTEDLPHIFELFFRSNDATEWNQDGTGLGLTIVKQIVDLHNGRIEVYSLKNQGTCINLFFN